MAAGKSALSLLVDPAFRRLLPSIEVCFLGLFIHIVACSWVMAELTDSATMVALVTTITSLPPVLLSLLAGGLADVLDRRRVMILSQIFMFLVSLVLVGMAAAQLLTPAWVLVLAFLVTSGNATLAPAWIASLGDIAPRDQLPEAVSLHTISANLMKTLGPVLGGVVLATAGSTAAFLVGSLSYVPAIVALALWRAPKREDVPGASIGRAISEGVRFIVEARHVHPIVQRVFLFGFCSNGMIALLPLVARDQFTGEADIYGLLYGSIGIGAIPGGLLLSRLRRAFGIERVVTGMTALCAAAILVLALTHAPIVGLAATFVCGACWLVNLTLLNSTLQLSAPRRLVGRMVSMHLTFTYLGLALGSWGWGIVAEHFGLQIALVASAVAMAGTALIAIWRPLPDVTGPEPDPLAGKP